MEELSPNETPLHALRLPFSFARRHRLIYLPEQEQLVCGKGTTLTAIAEACRFLGRTLPVERAEEQRFDALLQSVYEQEGNGSMLAMGELDEEFDLNDVAQQIAEPEDLMESQDDAPIIRLINALLTEAVREGASDIHIESFEHDMVVRLRVDGILREVLRPQRALAPLLVSRIKVMARLDIAEKRLPQDGRISLKVAGRPVDVRVSTLPAGHGERVVLRLLDKQAGRLDLAHLGMEAGAQGQMDALIHYPHGILLVTGPTGSGKTTTLYAAITRLNDSKRNILTVEDPIEYYLDGIGQTQVNSKVDMSFARGLRAILRQDPDVVMVGEIRDVETVEIAIQASLTGHLVLSTLHTNTAIGAITRLRDMGVEPFLLSSSLIGVLAQRLVRLLCPQCKQLYQANEHDCARMGVATEEAPTIYRAAEGGCDHCNHLGYRGRTGVYELITIDQTLRGMIHDGQGEHEMERYARQHSGSILDDGVRRVLAGKTSLEEVLRVCQAQ
ncbi:MAG: type II secretion system ATPase GspE [Gammaproteobacteria bacterium]|nr:type II secretion system ATPase GspE [Gammaproteobacteria bacterium]MCW8841736.1 type II secretion system ATPase GspE [Gammaproteobacteria bacterium]MCW8958242.1 type II secretion system ATPase GspE [Gammaproteobacteria bacterium]MCW8973546.1 type II secretion system ATPase GspE [Gammaproteobacteria bacterium]MCW8993643.1 type II secretion system ATPase GspE [Gammaproteobacteria bacterium]